MAFNATGTTGSASDEKPGLCWYIAQALHARLLDKTLPINIWYWWCASLNTSRHTDAVVYEDSHAVQQVLGPMRIVRAINQDHVLISCIAVMNLPDVGEPQEPRPSPTLT
eukprot:6393500-Amphidinium_carterae.3